MRLKAFFETEEGAVTVDWVVLTAAVIGLMVAAMSMVSTGTGDLSGEISAVLSAVTVASGN